MVDYVPVQYKEGALDMSFTRFEPPTKKKVLNEQLSERSRRTKNPVKRCIWRMFLIEPKEAKAEVELSIYRQRYPDTWKRRPMTLSRVKLSPGMFVINEEGDIRYWY
jgi:hypothetical protein